MRYFIDTEFIEAPGHLDPISVALACQDDREFYAINAECDFSRAGEWVQANVIPKLPPRTDPRWMSKAQIATGLRAFVGDTVPEFWGYFSSYDWVLFCWLLGGRMVDLPQGWPGYCLDLKQEMVARGIRRKDLPKTSSEVHDALVDARWLRGAHGFVMQTTRLG